MASKVKQNGWVVFIFMLLVGICFAMNNYKVPPNMLNISATLNTTITLVGNLMTMVGLAGVIMTLPGGGLVKKYGPRKVGIAALICTVIGAFVSVLVPNIYVMLVARFVESIGFCLVPVVALTVIPAWFPPEKRGLPMGIWSCWITFGMLIMMNASSPLTAAYNYFGSFWLAAILMVVALILFVAFVRMPESVNQQVKADAGKPGAAANPVAAKVSAAEAYKTPAIWLLALAFLGFAFLNQAVASFYSTYMQLSLGMEAAAANAATSGVAVGGIIAAIIIGLCMNKIPNKHHTLLLLVLTLCAAVCAFMLFRYTDTATIGIFTVITGVIIYMIPPVTFNIAPTTMKHPALIPIAMAIVNFAMNVAGVLNGFFISPMVNAIKVSGSSDWSTPAMTLTIVAACLVIGGIGQFIAVKKQQRDRTAALEAKE